MSIVYQVKTSCFLSTHQFTTKEADKKIKILVGESNKGWSVVTHAWDDINQIDDLTAPDEEV